MRRPALHTTLHPQAISKRRHEQRPENENENEPALKRARFDEEEWDSELTETDTESDYSVYTDDEESG